MLSTNIKETTKTAHIQLEKRVVQHLKAITSYEDYAEFLKCFYAYFSELEKVIMPFITKELLPDYKARRNSTSLKNDILESGYTVQGLPDVAMPQIGNALGAFGALYVMEGSVMGGSIIVEMLRKRGIVKGVTFFSGYGEETGKMWGTFISVLNNLTGSAQEQDIVIQAAEATFNNFGLVFKGTYIH